MVMEDRVSLNQLTRSIISSAMQVHSVHGPGLLEPAYQTCLEFEQRERGLKVEREKPLPVVYKQVRLDCGYFYSSTFPRLLELRQARAANFRDQNADEWRGRDPAMHPASPNLLL
jgi:hypothetical protein